MATPVWARLGETESAVVARYGRMSVKIHRAWGDEAYFSMNGFNITVTLINGVSAGELYRCTGHIITDAEASDFLSANSEGYAWYEHPEEIPQKNYSGIKQIWKRPNGSTAVLTGTTFEVKSIDLIIAQQNAANPKPVVPTTQGF
ncbi:MAG: hypothetical protein LV481_00200 [Methylacidiphilales bacterium]|nr:hypothetical protein [Candidatus Methylacidiphilales bacterium]